MWKIRDIKRKAIKAVKKNYIKALIVAIFLGISLIFSFHYSLKVGEGRGSVDDVEEVVEMTEKEFETIEDVMISIESDLDDALDEIRPVIDEEFGGSVETFLLVVGGAVFIILFVLAVVVIILTLFVLNPLQVGCRNFFVNNIDDTAILDDFLSGYGTGYKNVVKVMFNTQLRIVLWSLLFVIPGVVKSYEYRMVPYLLAKNPNMSSEEALKISSEMMNGNKFRTFLFDLSFIGWRLLDLVTFGATRVLFTNPYKYQAEAVLFAAFDGKDFSKKEINDEEFQLYMEV